ncbi:MAG: tetratricopeptide repeat protein [Sedimentisphaerales bacterium]|nr:tetratricopeptide repeat protein [Sedimentisphaerales bacterium]
MEQLVEPEVNLFSDTLPSLEDIKTLSDYIHSGEKNMLDFAQKVEENMSNTSNQSSGSLGIGLYILGRNEEAVEKLQKAKDSVQKYIYMAYAQRKLLKFNEAVESLLKSLNFGADSLFVSLEKAETYRRAKNYEAAAEQLKSCVNFENVSAEYHYQLGRLDEAQGLYQQAIENYEKATELSPNFQEALFYLAFRYDLSGNEDAAISCYKQIASHSPTYVSALLNLAVLYEDREQFEKAAKCIYTVLETHPNHQRAILFRKDIESSKTMFYDEEKEMKKTRKNQILETPISDFELSVRSRNCLKKMKIRTLGDLLNISEAELLSYKNFGETSLKEVRAILESKNLHLGMTLDDKPFMQQETEDLMHLSEQDQGLLNKPIDDLQLSVRARKCLQKLNLKSIGELTSKTEAELLGCKNFGVTSLNEIKKSLSDIELSLRSLD